MGIVIKRNENNENNYFYGTSRASQLFSLFSFLLISFTPIHFKSAVIWSFVKIENGLSKSSTIIINIYIYLIVRKIRVSEIENDQMTMTTLTTNLRGLSFPDFG